MRPRSRAGRSPKLDPAVHGMGAPQGRALANLTDQISTNQHPQNRVCLRVGARISPRPRSVPRSFSAEINTSIPSASTLSMPEPLRNSHATIQLSKQPTVGEPISKPKRDKVGRTVISSFLTCPEVLCDDSRRIPTHKNKFPCDFESSRPLATAPNRFCDRFLWFP